MSERQVIVAASRFFRRMRHPLRAAEHTPGERYGSVAEGLARRARLRGHVVLNRYRSVPPGAERRQVLDWGIGYTVVCRRRHDNGEVERCLRIEAEEFYRRLDRIVIDDTLLSTTGSRSGEP